MNKENIEKLETLLERLINKDNTIYFLTYDTKNNPRASVKYIYDLALTLKNSGANAKIIVEDKSYSGVNHWLGDTYNSLEVKSIKDDKVEINNDDILIIPEYYSNVLEQLKSIRCMKIMLVQQMEYVFETLPIGSRWSDYDIYTAITTTESAKKYILSIFPETIVYIIPPIIGDGFKPSEKSRKPYIAISCRNREISRKIISEFYLLYPHLRWFAFRDMVQLSYEEFSDVLKECVVSVWVDDESTFGTFALESMKCDVPVIGKIPSTDPDWLKENGIWTYKTKDIPTILGSYLLSWVEGSELDDEVKTNIKETLVPYETKLTENTIISIFNSIRDKRVESIKTIINKAKETE